MSEKLRISDLTKEEYFISGHRLCAGCDAAIIARQILKAVEPPFIIVNATCCLEVASTIYPFTAWKVPWVHNAFENAAATGSGCEAAIEMMVKKGKMAKEDAPQVVVIGGDGGTFDIGLQSLSGAIERGHNFLYVCYDNEAYMNTGIQRSGATMHAAWTTTSPAGKVMPGKPEWKKPLAKIIAAHGLEYVATASPAYPLDLIRKVKRGVAVDGPAFLHVISPCMRGWRFEANLAIEIARLPVQTRIFPLYEVEWGYKYTLNQPSPKRKKVPVEEYLSKQGRFRHLFKPEKREDIISDIQKHVDKQWEVLLDLCHIEA